MNIAPSSPRRCNLILHCGAAAVSRRELASVPTPQPTHTWMPIAHTKVLAQIERTLKANDIEVLGEAHSLTADGQRYFGLLEVRHGHNANDYSWVLGLRNSHDKTFPAGIVAGVQVFVCDNLSFSGEVKLARRHTRFILRDLPTLAHTAVSRIVEQWHTQDQRIAAYGATSVTDAKAHDIVIRAADVGAITNRHIPEVLREWREPRHSDFAPRTAWSLFNAFTEGLKGNLSLLPERTTALQGLFDSKFGFRLHGKN
ncbi:MAG TPA: DUF932 domain-containing protein [Chthoniobacterales bacterium]